MKILLVNPPYISLSGIKESAGHSIPLNLAYLAAYTGKHVDCGISILDAENLEMSYDGIRERIVDEKPDVIGITCPTPLFNHAVKIAQISKNVDSKIVVVIGGAHPTVFPQDVARLPCIDFVVRGEGEVTFVELIKAIKSGKSTFEHINGIAFKDSGKVVVTAGRELIGDLDEIPFPARELFNLDAYYAAPTKKVSNYKSTSMITARGCPYDCIHCISRLVWKRKVRYRSVDNIIDEIEECINKYGIREFNFYDDTFTIDKKRTIAICKEIIRRGLEISWICFGRVNMVDEEMVGEMKKAGCRKMSFGLESGSQNILDTMRKKSTLEMAKKAVKTVFNAGLAVHASFMLGNIGETAKTIRETIDFAKELDLDNATFFITAPFPGTDLYDIAKDKGNITGESAKWEQFAPLTKASPVLVQDNLSQEELVGWQKKAFKEFYLRPRYVMRKFTRISSFSDLKLLLEGLRVFFRLQKK